MTSSPLPRPLLWWTTTADGWSLALRTYSPAGPARASLLLSPGMMLDGRAMDRPAGSGLASFFRDRGYLATTLDLRGHGSSRPRAARRVDWNFDDLVLRDIPAACQAMRAAHPELPLIWLGHSLSAHAGAVASGLDPELGLQALVLLCPGPWLRVLEPSATLWWGKRTLLLAWSALTAACGRFPAQLLAVGTNDESRGFVFQHLRWARRDGWRSTDGRHDYLEATRRVQVPSLVIAAEGDLLCRPAQVERFAAILGDRGSPATYWRIDRARLSSHRQPRHMGVLTALPSHRLWEEIAGWIDRELTQSPPAAPLDRRSPGALHDGA